MRSSWTPTPEGMRYLAHGPSSRDTTTRAHRDRLEQAHRMPRMGLCTGFTDEQFVGWWLLRPRSRTIGDSELGYRFIRRLWRQGLASEGGRELIRHAFVDLAATRVYAETMKADQASRATRAAGGLRYVRAFRNKREPTRLGAEFGDVEYAMIREQWTAQQPGSRS